MNFVVSYIIRNAKTVNSLVMSKERKYNHTELLFSIIH